MKISRMLFPVLLAALLAAGCAGQAVKAPEEGGTAPGAQSPEAGEAGSEPGAESIPLGQDGALAADPLDDPESLLSKRVIYFDFDSSQVKPEFVEVIAAHGRYLAAHPSARIRLEGHADERGTREYNVGLGERRAKAVERMILLQGASRDQIEVVSYGEELPVALGHDEQSWALNRRVEINYLSR